MQAWLNTTFAALASHHFRVLWTGTALAFVAFFMSTAVQSVVAYDLEENNSAVGVVVFAQGIAQLLLGPFGGALADRISKKLLILACQAVITAAFFALALLIATDRVTILFLAAGSFAIGSAFSFLGPARQGLMVELVGPHHRGNAVALSQVALNASRIFGPAFAGVFVAFDVLGAQAAYAAMGLLYVVAMWTTVVIPDAKPAGAGRSVFGDIALGLRYTWEHPRIRLLVLSYVLIITCGFPYVTVLPALVEDELGRSAGSVTALFAISAVGGLAASLGVASRADSARAAIIYRTMCILFGASLVVSGIAPTFLSLVAAMFFVGVGSGGFQTLNGAILSHITEPAFFGRVVSLTFMAFAVFGVVALPIGIIADAVGERATLAGMGLAVCGVVAVFTLLERSTAAVPAGVPVSGGGH